ncbi:hypothetical protein SAMN02910417_01089 [Eubacterium oxidoreducens]|uniref:Uncharacterized protein n=1 Tax=Eubacterium oxidoreducens TaxID=1732 RepID=A0A1G6B2I6_EUBOX|nr:hypothetical protein SAMN02910417_01089 [Eubacterium oxidoreducens]
MRDGYRGCRCDNCLKRLEPHEAIKIQFKKYTDKGTGEPIHGIYKTFGKMDLCEECFKLEFGEKAM